MQTRYYINKQGELNILTIDGLFLPVTDWETLYYL